MNIQNTEQEFLEMVVKNLVSKQDGVKITRTIDKLGVLYTIVVDPTDVAKVIGKQGSIAQAIRLLLKVVGYKYNVRASMKIDTSNSIKAK